MLSFDYFSADQTIHQDFGPGSKLYAKGYRQKFPVVMIPGIVTSGLEAWSTDNSACGQRYFRKRIWGTLNQLQAILMDKACWLKYMALDHETGLDPPNVRLRASSGLEATDYLFPGHLYLT